MKKRFLLLWMLPLSLFAQQKNVVQYVNPLIGTQRMGHTFPGAAVPFGMVQLSPDTDTLPYEMNGKYNPDVYKYCAGYQYDDKTIVGFSHTHFSGTGHSDLGDFLVMPTAGALQLNPGVATDTKTGFRSAFSHANEKAEAGYYKVKLDDDNITAELTATTRTGFHQYTFPKTNDAHIILDLMHGIYNYEDKNVWTFVRVENDTLVTGYRQTAGWARTRTVYFAMTFSKPFKEYGCKDFGKKQVYRGFWGKFNQTKNFPDLAGRQLRMFFNFNTEEGEKIKMKMALSSVSTEGALLNLRTEAPNWDFEQTKAAAQAAWNNELAKISIEASEAEKQNFYTALYHAFLGPTVYMDVDRKYKGLDQNIHTAANFTNYTTFSLWDTYRALHPFFNIIQPARNGDMVNSMLAHYDQSVLKMLPIWSHYNNDNWCMSGYHSVSVIADAIIKGNTSFDAVHALDACVTTASHSNYEGIGSYVEKGFIPAEKLGTSASTTLEYAYDDWSIAQAAKKLGRTDIYEAFSKRAGNYKNIFDPSVGFMRARNEDGSFKNNFDALSTNGQGFIEGNTWNYSFFVPQDPEGLINLMGGKKKFSARLDSLFTMYLPDKYFAETEDITRDGIIGTYIHGNEPAHHVAYLYNFAGQPWKTQERIRMILKHQYKPAPDGLGGNDDCGQMSAWYLFSTLGFYPVAPGATVYQLGSPAINKAVLQLENKNSFTVEAINQSDKNVYVQKVLLNGKQLEQPTITHEDIMKGGTLTFYMTDKPKKQ
ncbi:sugar hydrolase [Niastella koreensis]|uniref:Alpha-1,2-mannosidase n=2 Tax=Niastella koreensis TaxID=354356 RepID=G8TJR4_NIAKG|nr:GH92 family glycosyl hydrolase [Niastella koreensis]AEW01812.1 alpha-1,2-mannosidase [Niastella koreensis GR20-10]OQP48522.1 sugar hydrolase [Niastella koreensis]